MKRPPIQWVGGFSCKLGIPFWDYIGTRLGAAVRNPVPHLPDLVAARCQA